MNNLFPVRISGSTHLRFGWSDTIEEHLPGLLMNTDNLEGTFVDALDFELDLAYRYFDI